MLSAPSCPRPAQGQLLPVAWAPWVKIGIPSPLHLSHHPKGRYWGPSKLHTRTSQDDSCIDYLRQHPGYPNPFPFISVFILQLNLHLFQNPRLTCGSTSALGGSNDSLLGFSSWCLLSSCLVDLQPLLLSIYCW